MPQLLEMPLIPAPFRALSPLTAVAAPAGAPRAVLYGRRVPLAGTLLFLSTGAVACMTGCAFCHRRLPFFGARRLSSAQMESASTAVPSIVVYVTVPNREAGKKLSQSIISEKLAACVNIVPGIESVYWWEGKVQTDAEELLIIKTRESLLDALTTHVKANHEYDVPEVIALPITGGNTKYLEWIKNNTRGN
ncbi:protein CutA 1, chloroplastic-like [Phragmites australis]|uniref:protein CutA 1, chloroplastic-like n=1 Tax=Phragmites australis TaxID=29695 RepID=UPI002D7858C5|nr:protein CutA 1, chloroplastic-like [Phragmites australis]